MSMLLRRYHTDSANPEVKPVETEKAEEVKPKEEEVEQAKATEKKKGGRPKKEA